MMRRKKWIRNLLSFLTILCCLAGSITPVFASGTGSDVPRVTFTNEPRNSPDLYVTKTVENALEGAEYAAPEHAVFRFVLKINGEIAKNRTYRVLDPEYGEIIRKTSRNMEEPFQTDATGVFTLEAGQQAWFEGVGLGTRYEVLEQDTYLLPRIDDEGKEIVDTSRSLWSVQYDEETGTRTDTPLKGKKEVYVYDTRSLAVDGWQKKSPSGGSTGEHSILANGNSETFTNRYTGKGTGTTATLTVSKSVSFPTGYQAPDSTPPFPFVIELEGKPYANEAFTATNSRTGETRSMTTDSQGRFNLPGGWMASFENVPADVDYKVYEDTEAKLPEETLPEGDRDTDPGVDMEDSGGTRDMGTAEEIDDSGSTRSMEIQQEAETGERTDSSQSPENSEAVLVSRMEETFAGESLLVAERSASETERMTSDVKRMAVNSSQGMPSQGMPSQGSQISDGVTSIFWWPEDWWPTGDTVLTGSVQSPLTELNFHNSNVSFVVTKRLEGYSTGMFGLSFIFRLADEDNNALSGVKYYVYNTDGSPVYGRQGSGSTMNQVTVDGKVIRSGQTNEKGVFMLTPGQAAVFIGLKPGTSYRVTEIKDPDYTQILPSPEADTLHTVASDGQVSSIDFVNRPEDTQGTLSVTKTVAYGTSEGELSGDEFRFILYRRLTKDQVKALLGIGDETEIEEADIRSGLEDGKIVLAEPQLQMADTIQPSLPGTMLQNLDAETQESQVRLKAGARMNMSEDTASGGGMKHTDAWTYTIGGTDYAVYAPAEGMIFSIPEGLEAPTYKTGPYAQEGWLQPGEFALKSGQTARFQNKVKVGDEYLVREIGYSEEYRELMSMMSSYQKVFTKLPEDGTQDETFLAQGGMIADGTDGLGGLALSFQNLYTPKKIDLVLTKTDGNGEKIADLEAHFMLYRTEGGLDGPVLPESLEDGTVPDPDTFVYKTENGVLTIPNLKAGTYWLYERKAPSGYCLLPEPVEIDLRWTEGGLAITIDGAEYVRGTESDGEILYIRSGDPADAAAGSTITVREGTTDMATGNTTNTAVGISIRNTELYELPSTGGIGIYWYSIGGTLLMLAAALILYKYQRRGRC